MPVESSMIGQLPHARRSYGALRVRRERGAFTVRSELCSFPPMDFGFGKDVLWDVRGLSVAGRYRRGPSPSLSSHASCNFGASQNSEHSVVLAASHLLAVRALLTPHRACRFGHLPVAMDIGLSARAPRCVHTGLRTVSDPLLEP